MSLRRPSELYSRQKSRWFAVAKVTGATVLLFAGVYYLWASRDGYAAALEAAQRAAAAAMAGPEHSPSGSAASASVSVPGSAARSSSSAAAGGGDGGSGEGAGEAGEDSGLVALALKRLRG